MTKSHSASSWLVADWPAPANICAGVSTRLGGHSIAPYNSLNVGGHVGDEAASVRQNRHQLFLASGAPQAPCWLKQTHSTHVVDAGAHYLGPPEADASFSTEPDAVCCVMTADCLPLLVCDRAGAQIAAVHAGWRGLADGIIEKTLARFSANANDILVWLGPAISQTAFEVGDEVRDIFLTHDVVASQAFLPSPQGRWMADLYGLAKQRLAAVGVTQVYGGQYCTHQDAQRFFSYRRDGVTGRMAAMIWMNRQHV